MSKSNVSSIRYTDEVKKIIDSIEGNSFSDKFHSLVEYCYNKIPYLEKKEKDILNRIENRKLELKRINDKINSMNDIIDDIDSIQYAIKRLTEDINKM